MLPPTHTHTHVLMLSPYLCFLFPVTFTDTEVMHLAKALRQLHESNRSSLTELSISALPRLELMQHLLAASPNITSLHVEIQSVWGLQDSSCHYCTTESGVPKLLSVDNNRCLKELLFICSCCF